MQQYFGTTADGKKARLFRLENARGTRAELTDYGASLVRFLFRDRNGILRDLVLGYDDVSGYEKGAVFFGGTIGRVANRIGGASFTLDGNTYKALHLSGSMDISQGLFETTKGAAPEATKTDYAAASKTDRDIHKTILRVDKQEQIIQALVTTTENTKNELTGQIETITKTVEQTMTAEQVQILVSETVGGIDSITTETGYTFDKDGLRIHKAGEEIENRLDNTGMYVERGGENVLTANAEGVEAMNLTTRQYLTIGTNARFEDYGSGRTACFYIGG